MTWREKAQKSGFLTLALEIFDDTAEQARVEGDKSSAYRLQLARNLMQMVICSDSESSDRAPLWNHQNNLYQPTPNTKMVTCSCCMDNGHVQCEECGRVFQMTSVNEPHSEADR